MITKTTPTLQILRSEDRGHADHGWLNARHSFSFANYHNPEQMGFRSLRVINQDRIAGGGGFPTHPHRDMEIFTYVLSGALNHTDSMGNEGSIRPGQIQLMSAGTGVTHSEFNGSNDEEASLLQVWISPEHQGLTPSYTDWAPNPEQRSSMMALLISPDGREQSATIHQDAYIYRIKIQTGETVSHNLAEGRGAWIQMIHGELRINNIEVSAGDAGFTEENGWISLTAIADTEALFFDLK